MQIPADGLFDKLDTHRLPSIDQLLVEIIQLCGRDHVTFDELAEMMEADAALTVKVLTIANSPAYYPVRRFVSLRSALITLGMETIKTLVITASLRQVLDRVQVGTVFDKRRFWQRSLYSGLLVKELVGLVGYGHSDEAYLAGLLYNIGELVIASNFPSECGYNSARKLEEQLAFEQRQFGFNRYDVGAWLVSQWRLNPFISDAILYQQEPIEQVVNAHILVRLVYLASHLSFCEAGPGETEFHLADRMFGLSAGLVRNLSRKVEQTVIQIAQSMSIELAEPNSGYDSRSSDPLISNGGIVPGFPKGESSALYALVRERALLDSVKPLIDGANDLGELLDGLRICTYILFGSRNTLLFVADPDRRLLAGTISPEKYPDDPLSQVDVLLRDEHSVIAAAFTNNAEKVSVVRSRQHFASIVDRQIAKLFAADVLYCIPVAEGERAIGVIVLVISESRVSEYKANRWLLKALGAVVAKMLHRLHPICQESEEKAAASIRSESDRLSARKVRSLVHEANNPLTVLKNYISVLANKLTDAHQEELRIIRDEIDRVARIIAQIADETWPNEEAIDINELIVDLLKIYRASYSGSGNVTFNFIPDERLPITTINPDLLKQILVNLLKNALEAIGENGIVEITTKSEFVVGGERYLEIVVSDSGPGISKDVKAHLFKQPASTKGGTRGYGLMIVKNILREIGGLIHVKNCEKKGTSFQVLIPIEKQS